jgi:Trk K+ transport system NAD-binding subunit
MYIVIAGGGAVGQALARTLIDNRHDVAADTNSISLAAAYLQTVKK